MHLCVGLALLFASAWPLQTAAGNLPEAAAEASGTAANPGLTGRSTALHRAAKLDRAHDISQLLGAGADVNARDEQGYTPLHQAIREESANAVKALLASAELDVAAITPAGETPLMLAAIKGQLGWCQALVQRGAPVNEPGWNALHYAASGPSHEVVAWLLKQGATVDARAPNGNTALMMALGYGSISAAELLLQAGADPELRNDKGLNTWDYARMAGREDMVRRLGLRRKPG
ncbi:ankyrin repeat domain-containing protein [Roseateles sp. BYS180W]|uniref:Ankyrin repeat domain-containing protein n=1 Tax=Roseateles rivi TaxID=3299028 RepID=A0ABW7FXT6_9BURK